MKIIILAGGFGTRLGELTKKNPKPMMKIGEKSILHHIVDRLDAHGLHEIIVKVHYLPFKIIEGIGDRVLYYYEPVLYDWKETMWNLRNWLEDEEFMVINGDTISEVNFTEMIAFHQKGQNDITAFMDDYRCCGVWIYKNIDCIQKEVKVRPYRPGVSWYDCGTPERLQAAREHFEQGKKNVCP